MIPIDCVPLLESHNLYDMAAWASSRPVRHGWKGRTCGDLWDAAPRGADLLYYAIEAGADRRDLVRAAAACARPALRFVPKGEDRPRLAVEAAERWADEPTEQNRRRARRAANAVWRLDEDAMRSSSYAAVEAGGGPAEAAANARRVRWAAWAAWKASNVHLYTGAREAASHRACADEVRRLVPFLDLSAPQD